MEEVFTPEDLTEEHRQIAATAAQFARDEIVPATPELEAKEPGRLLGSDAKGRGILGFTSVDIPEARTAAWEWTRRSSTLITDRISVLASFSTAFGAQIGIGTLAAGVVRDGGTEEEEVSAEAGDGGVDRGLLPVGVDLGIRCDEYSNARDVVG